MKNNPTAAGSAAKKKRKQDRHFSTGDALILGMTGLYSVLLLLVSHQTAIGPEYRWWSTANLYLPQALWGLPPLLLLVGVWRLSRRLKWLPLIALLPLAWVAGPMMGFCWPVSSLSPGTGTESPSDRLRLMTYNIEEGNGDAAGVMKTIAYAQPDVLLMQEASGSGIEEALKVSHPDWHIRVFGELLIASPFPITHVERQLLPTVPDAPWKSPAYVRCSLQVGAQTVVLYNVHLSTPRPALEALRRRDAGAIALIESSANARIYQSSLLAKRVSREISPTIVAGDFNAPQSSVICRQILQRGYKDAFATAGRGYGYTTGHKLRPYLSFARIDHIFTSPAWDVLYCGPGESESSDHRPVIADLRLAAADR